VLQNYFFLQKTIFKNNCNLNCTSCNSVVIQGKMNQKLDLPSTENETSKLTEITPHDEFIKSHV